MTQNLLDLFAPVTHDADLSTTVEMDAFTAHAAGAFDYTFTGTTTFKPWAVPEGIPPTFGIGAIVGPSGSGKSLLLKKFGNPQHHQWSPNKAIVSQVADTPEDAVDRLSAVGLNSIPSWMKPYHILSMGEQFRADLARSVGNGAVFDEFTSVIDRESAVSASRALRRYIDQRKLTGIVVATCHTDVLPWLEPDWVFFTQTSDHKTGELLVGRCLHPRPPIQLDLYETGHSAWAMFADHHYLTREIQKASRCYAAFWGDKLVAFTSVLPLPHGMIQDAWREHRTVVLPQHQGLGIGPRLADTIGALYREQGCRYFSRTAHARLGSYRDNSPAWRPTAHNHKVMDDPGPRSKVHKYGKWKIDKNRICYSHEYVGGALTQEPRSKAAVELDWLLGMEE